MYGIAELADCVKVTTFPEGCVKKAVPLEETVTKKPLDVCDTELTNDGFAMYSVG